MSLKDTHGPKSSTIAQTSIKNMVWPNFFLMNVFFALNGSKLLLLYLLYRLANQSHI